ncbi:serine/threonine-protein phosphatase 2A activator [Prunus avium]|uniref:Serine/threonine-protein phosphatase 2A activator n=1 Tax=Prunus avium TaxID=42229 RepID=A0A6P5RYG4_PRUAV|nr:serine/threonine-protein phosphatase 2A activator [Prunus avium]
MEPQHQPTSCKTEDHHHHYLQNPSSSGSPRTTTLPTPTCCKCGAPTPMAAPPPSFSDISPPPNYRPIRAPAINLPPNPKHFLGFVAALSDSIRAKKISDPCHESTTIATIVSILQTLIQWVDEIPPTKQAARYGNVSFRSWHERLSQTSDSLVLQFLPEHLHASTIEIVPYFTDSFGNPSRIDYGTGHETNFAAWLYCLARMGVIKEEDYPAVVARVLVKYLDLMRKLQLVYCLEPAGSHGVWGLDDYHFLPFIFGSSQLIGHKYMKPKSIHNDDIVENFSKEYLYISGIEFIKKVKKGPFSEHSPLLDDISGVPNWNKVNSGLLKMYKAEVLEKVPIMQHFLFGWLIKWE